MRHSAAGQLSVTPLARIGATVHGVDLSRPGDPDMAGLLRDALAAHQFLVFRGQRVAPGDQLRFTENFGDLDPGIGLRPASHRVEGELPVLKVSNGPGSATQDYGFGWHSDGLAYARRPHGATILYCSDCPAGAGDTLFTSQYDTYDAISPAGRDAMDGLHWYLPPIPYSEVPPGKGLIQPLIRQHPVTGKRFVYLAPQAVRIRDLTRAQSAEIFDVVRRAQARDDAVYRHSWRAGDLIVWENCALLHSRADAVDHSTQGPRIMHRTATIGRFEAQESEPMPPS